LSSSAWKTICFSSWANKEENDWKCPRCRKPKDQFVEKQEKKEPTYMEEKKVILEAMKKAGEPLNAGKIAELTGLDRKVVDKAMAEMKKDGSIVSPVRCKWEPAEK
jgi:hypothetical protein